MILPLEVRWKDMDSMILEQLWEDAKTGKRFWKIVPIAPESPMAGKEGAEANGNRELLDIGMLSIRESIEKAAIQKGKNLYLKVVVVDEEEAKTLMSEVSLGHKFFGCQFAQIWWTDPVQLAKDKIIEFINDI